MFFSCVFCEVFQKDVFLNFMLFLYVIFSLDFISNPVAIFFSFIKLNFSKIEYLLQYTNFYLL